ncbi:glycosyltransferase [Isosphaeraceae bacterium EP7]
MAKPRSGDDGAKGTSRAIAAGDRAALRNDPTSRRALVVADANWFTTENLFGEIPEGLASTLLLKCMDYNNALRRGIPPWSWGGTLERKNQGQWERDLILPSGWMKRFPRLGMRPIARAVRKWRSEHAAGGRLSLVFTYPHYLYLRDMISPDDHVYYNVDDYSLYWPRAADEVRALELRAVRESTLTVCVSALRADELRAAVPAAAHKVHHLPHGAPRGSIDDRAWPTPAEAPADLTHLPRPYLGYVGTMEDRVDWSLVETLARSMPAASIILIGRLSPDEPEGRQTCLSLPNVHHLGWRPQVSIHAYNRAFDVCLIPYLADHPFNRACCPTKIMDYMGSSRPIVSTALPECLLYSHLFAVAATTPAFLEAVRSIVDAGSDDGLAQARHAWAVEHTCGSVVRRLLSWLPE